MAMYSFPVPGVTETTTVTVKDDYGQEASESFALTMDAVSSGSSGSSSGGGGPVGSGMLVGLGVLVSLRARKRRKAGGM